MLWGLEILRQWTDSWFQRHLKVQGSRLPVIRLAIRLGPEVLGDRAERRPVPRSWSKKRQNTTAPGVPAWFLNVVLIWPNSAWLPRSDGIGCIQSGMTVACPSQIIILSMLENAWWGSRILERDGLVLCDAMTIKTIGWTSCALKFTLHLLEMYDTSLATCRLSYRS